MSTPCPYCNQQLVSPKSGTALKVASCPHCKTRIRVAFDELSYEPAPVPEESRIPLKPLATSNQEETPYVAPTAMLVNLICDHWPLAVFGFGILVLLFVYFSPQLEQDNLVHHELELGKVDFAEERAAVTIHSCREGRHRDHARTSRHGTNCLATSLLLRSCYFCATLQSSN